MAIVPSAPRRYAGAGAWPSTVAAPSRDLADLLHREPEVARDGSSGVRVPELVPAASLTRATARARTIVVDALVGAGVDELHVRGARVARRRRARWCGVTTGPTRARLR